MKAKSMRSFSLSLEVQTRLETVIQKAKSNGLASLVGEPELQLDVKEPLIDGLRASDYDRIFDLLETTNKHRAQSRQVVVDEVNRRIQMGFDHNRYFQLRAQIDEELKAQKKAAKAAPLKVRSRVGNYSTVVEALLNLGMDALQERSSREQEGSNNGHAGRLEEKQPRSRSRKAVAA